MLLRIISISEIILSILLVAAILMQSKGSGLGSVFGGEGNVYTVRRGTEKVLFVGTIVLAILLAGLTISHLFLV